MRVKELIEFLKKFDQNTLVVLDNYDTLEPVECPGYVEFSGPCTSIDWEYSLDKTGTIALSGKALTKEEHPVFIQKLKGLN